MKLFTIPDTHNYQAAHLSTKTRKLSDGRFEAIAAIYFMGQRGLTVYSIASSRGRAERQASEATESSSKLRTSLKAGLVSYSQAVIS